jgi:hypothetical protein
MALRGLLARLAVTRPPQWASPAARQLCTAGAGLFGIKGLHRPSDLLRMMRDTLARFGHRLNRLAGRRATRLHNDLDD